MKYHKMLVTVAVTMMSGLLPLAAKADDDLTGTWQTSSQPPMSITFKDGSTFSAEGSKKVSGDYRFDRESNELKLYAFTFSGKEEAAAFLEKIGGERMMNQYVEFVEMSYRLDEGTFREFAMAKAEEMGMSPEEMGKRFEMMREAFPPVEFSPTVSADSFIPIAVEGPTDGRVILTIRSKVEGKVVEQRVTLQKQAGGGSAVALSPEEKKQLNEVIESLPEAEKKEVKELAETLSKLSPQQKEELRKALGNPFAGAGGGKIPAK